jgi:hypothetical protein
MQNAHGNPTDKQLSPLKIKEEPNQSLPERPASLEVNPIPQFSPSSAPGIWMWMGLVMKPWKHHKFLALE